jgi:organic radical activating enzyme
MEIVSANLILTQECAKRCSFCFTGDYSKKTEMSLDFIDRFLKHFSDSITYINLLGGEPTQHRNFTKIIEKLIKYNVKYQLTTNLLFSKSILKFLSKNTKCRGGFLVNGMELFEKRNRFKTFKRNYNELCKTSRTFNDNNEMGGSVLAFTLSQKSTPELFKKYINTLKNELTDISVIRIGLDLSNTDIANNTMYGDTIRAIQEELPRCSIKFDCQIPRCIFNYEPNKILYSYCFLFSNCISAPVDIFYDKSCIMCFQTRHIKVNNIFDFNSMKELRKELRTQYKEKERSVDILKVCKTCDYYLDNQCNSLCVGCYTGGHGLNPAEI